MHFECLIRFRKSNQLLMWLKSYTTMPITKWFLPHWVIEVIAVAPCRAFTGHYIPTDTEWMLERPLDYYHKTSRSANLSGSSCMYLGVRKKYADIVFASHFLWEEIHNQPITASWHVGSGWEAHIQEESPPSCRYFFKRTWFMVVSLNSLLEISIALIRLQCQAY